MTRSPPALLLALVLLVSGVGAAQVPAGAAGDVVLVGAGDTAYPTGWFSASARKKGAKMFALVKPWLDGADLRFVNLESPVTTREASAKKTYPLVSHPEFLDLLVGAGFDLFSLANNHTGDAGEEGVADTFANLERLNTTAHPLHWAGAGLTRATRAEPAYFERKGQRFALLAFRLTGHPLSNPMSGATAQIRKAAAKADVVIVSAHGGGEYKSVPGGWKAKKWRAFVDAGADVVLAHGPHNPQGLQWYKGAAIYYSLGNFSFGTRPRRKRTGGMLLRALLARVTFAGGKVQKAQAVPLYVDNVVPWIVDGKKQKVRTFTPAPLGGGHARALLRETREWSDAIPGNRTKITACGPEGSAELFCFEARPR